MMRILQTKFLIPLLLATLYPLPARAGLTDFKTIKTAQQAYQAKDYNRTIRALNRLKTPSPERNFDLGDAYYKAGNLDAALRMYKRAKGGSIDEEKRLHNIGNVYFKKKQYDHAVTAYETALKVHDDPDTRFNLELAKKMKKKQEQKKKKKQQQKQKKQNKKDQKKNKDKNKKNQNKQPNKKNQNKNKNNDKNSQKKPNNKQGKQPRKQSQDKPGDKKKTPKNKTGKPDQKKKPEQKKGDKQSQSQSKPGEPKQKKKPEKAQGASRTKATQAQKIQAKEIKRLMKQLKGKKMQPRLYQFVGKKHTKPNPPTVNPW